MLELRCPQLLQKQIIEIQPPVTHKTFEALLDYIYTGDCSPLQYLTTKELINLILAFNGSLPTFTTSCRNTILQKIEVNNVFLILQESKVR
jgi:hypothetical protein